MTPLFTNIITLNVRMQCNVEEMIGKKGNVSTSNDSITLTVQDSNGTE